MSGSKRLLNWHVNNRVLVTVVVEVRSTQTLSSIFYTGKIGKLQPNGETERGNGGEKQDWSLFFLFIEFFLVDGVPMEIAVHVRPWFAGSGALRFYRSVKSTSVGAAKGGDHELVMKDGSPQIAAKSPSCQEHRRDTAYPVYMRSDRGSRVGFTVHWKIEAHKSSRPPVTVSDLSVHGHAVTYPSGRSDQGSRIGLVVYEYNPPQSSQSRSIRGTFTSNQHIIVTFRKFCHGNSSVSAKVGPDLLAPATCSRSSRILQEASPIQLRSNRGSRIGIVVSERPFVSRPKAKWTVSE
nr:unnamed protein product [Haemonchus contortus]